MVKTPSTNAEAVVSVTLFCCLVAQSCLNLLQPHELPSARLLYPWYFPGKNTSVGYHFLLQVQSLGQEHSLKKEMLTYSSNLVWKIPWTEELGRLQSIGSQKIHITTQRLNDIVMRERNRVNIVISSIINMK